MVICPSCGGENADDALFCGFCGAKLQSGQKKTLFGIAAIPKGDLEKAAKQAREATEKAKAEKAEAEKSAPKEAKADKAVPKEAKAEPEVRKTAAPPSGETPVSPSGETPVSPSGETPVASTDSQQEAEKAPEKKRERISLTTPATAKPESASEESKDDGWSLDGLELSSDTNPTVPDVEEEEPKAGLDTIEEVDSETGPTLVDAEVGPTVQMEVVPPLKKESLETPAASAGTSTVPSAAPVEKKPDADEVTTLEDDGPPGADGTIAKGIGAETTLDGPAEAPTRAGEATLKSAPKVRPVESGPRVRVRESAVSEAAAQQKKPEAKPAATSGPRAKPESLPQQNPVAGPSTQDYPAPVKPGSKEDEEAFFGASLSQYGMAPVQQNPVRKKVESDSDLKPSGGINWGIIIFGFFVIGAIIGAIAFLLSVGAE